jgi:hypothetical protein
MKVSLARGVTICALGLGAMLVAACLNPQPLPPGFHLNPQPLPPGYQHGVTPAKEQHPVPPRGGDAVASP